MIKIENTKEITLQAEPFLSVHMLCTVLQDKARGSARRVQRNDIKLTSKKDSSIFLFPTGL